MLMYIYRYIKVLEIWKDIENYEGIYKVSNYGRIKSLDREIPNKFNKTTFVKGRILRNKKGKYPFVSLCKEGNIKQCSVHRLVANAFLKKDLVRNSVNHKDGNHENNNLLNLEWCSQSENILHGWKVLNRKIVINNQKFSIENIKQVRNLYKTKMYLQKDLAKMFNMTRATVCLIVNDKQWKDI